MQTKLGEEPTQPFIFCLYNYSKDISSIFLPQNENTVNSWSNNGEFMGVVDHGDTDVSLSIQSGQRGLAPFTGLPLPLS
jgi:hypothetical protein